MIDNPFPCDIGALVIRFLVATPKKQIPTIKQGTDFLRWSVNGDTPMAWALTRQKLEGFYEKATSRSSDKAKLLP